MNILGRRVEVERLLALMAGDAPDLEKRRQVWMALDAASLEGGREMMFVAAAAVLLAGGKLEIRPATLAATPTAGALMITVNQETGAISITTEHQLAPEVLKLLAQSGGVVRETVPAAAPVEGEVFPPAAPEEHPGFALMRICDAVRLLLQRRYDGEIRARGFAFLPAVFGELLAMAVGIELANCQDQDQTIPKRVAELGEQLEARVLHYQTVSERQHAADQAEPGEPSPPNPSRLM